MSFVKNFKFFHSFVFVKVNLEEVFAKVLDRQKAFQAIKYRLLKNAVFGIFPKSGQPMIFLKNLKFPPSFSFVKTNLEKVFANDLD